MKINRLISIALALIALMAVLAVPALAKVVSPGEDFYYLDEAGVLSEATEGEIYFSNQLLEEACGAQVVVVALDTTGSTSIDDYAYDLMNQWGVGDSQKQNGFVLLMAIEDDDYYAVCGTNLRSRFTAGTLKQYFDEYLEADFAAKRYDAGARKFFEAAYAYIAELYDADVTTEQGIAAYEAWAAEGEEATDFGGYEGAVASSHQPAPAEDGVGMMPIVILVLLVILLVVLMRKRGRARRVYTGGPTVAPIIVNTARPRRRVFFGGGRMPGPGGYRGQDVPGAGWPGQNMPGPGGHRGEQGSVPPTFGTGGTRPQPSTSHPQASSTRPHVSSRPSSSGLGSFGRLFGGSSGGSSRSSFGGGRGGGGGTRGGGAGRGRH